MKFTLSWLKDHLDTDATLEVLSEKLTAIGLEVEGLEDRASALAPFKVARIITAEKHPDADRLKVCTVDTGSETIQVVCGAPNARAGLRTVLARPNDVIPSTGEALKLGKIRGMESQGMMCSGAELCLDTDAAGIMELPDDAPIGAKLVDVMDVADPVIEINLTPNRADCAGVRGIARDLAAAGLGTLRPMKISVPEGTEKCGVAVSLDFPEEQKHHCPLFVGRTIRNIKNGPSPAWLQTRLRAIGLRPISALVDITNYITFDCGRPLHVFDSAKIKGGLWVRPAKGGETFRALNDKDYTLEAGMTAIGDETGFLSLAGLVGGETSGCEVETKDVFIESAYFDPSRTAQTGRALGVTSDARYRFERGVDPAFVQDGADLAAQMILDLCGTSETVVSERLVVGAVPSVVKTVAYNPAKMASFIGVDVAADEQEAILAKLGFAVEKKSANAWTITPPSWRGDVEGAPDITEEIIRIKGFEHIPATSMPREDVMTPCALDLLDRRAGQAKRAFAAQGLMEAVTWSFMSSSVAQAFEPVKDELRLLNPISADLDVMRSSIVGNLVQAARRNADRGFGDVALFEVGPTYRNQTPEGQVLVATALRAGQTPRHWAEKARAVDAYDAKADALAALAAAGAPMASIQIGAGDVPAWYHPGRSGSLRLGPVLLGYFGELHPAVLQACDAQGPMVACELYLAAIPAPRKSGTARPLLKLEALQPVSRDFAFLLDQNVEADKMIAAIKKADKALIREVAIFDVYTGKGVADGKKSVALSVTMQPTDHTLTDAELEGLTAKIAGAVEKATGGVLRG
ncbi:MAG: phenylalanine--tRNA ligase subunit beta [Alphaproteobacteria bacterium]|nr:phenylalanine--tRNA ligase subunit beta [Alphaproteobacteria bacterium]